MRDRDVLTRLSAANPVPAADLAGTEDSPRAQILLRSVVNRGQERTRIRWRRAAVPAALVAAVVTAVVLANALTAAGPVPEPAPVSLATPQTILIAAADHAGRAPAQGDFVHVTGAFAQVLQVRSAGGYHVLRIDPVQSMHPAGGQPGEGWLTIGETGSTVQPVTPADAAAWAEDGRPGPGKLPAPASLDPDLTGDAPFEGSVPELPDDPARTGPAMLASVAAPADPQGWLFRQGTRLLDTFTEVAGGADRAKIYRMLAGLSGVRTLPGHTDPLGRAALGLAYSASTPQYGTLEWQIYIGADSDRITYSQAVVRTPGAANAGLHPGDVQYSTAVTSVTWSDKP
jgi:hypothetical protein